MKILNLGGKHANGQSHEIEEDDDDAFDPHLARIQSAAAGDESDEEVEILIIFKRSIYSLDSP